MREDLGFPRLGQNTVIFVCDSQSSAICTALADSDGRGEFEQAKKLAGPIGRIQWHRQQLQTH